MELSKYISAHLHRVLHLYAMENGPSYGPGQWELASESLWEEGQSYPEHWFWLMAMLIHVLCFSFPSLTSPELKDAGKYLLWRSVFSHHLGTKLASLSSGGYLWILANTHNPLPRPGFDEPSGSLSPSFTLSSYEPTVTYLRAVKCSCKKRPLCVINGGFRNLLVRAAFFFFFNREVGSFCLSPTMRTLSLREKERSQ